MSPVESTASNPQSVATPSTVSSLFSATSNQASESVFQSPTLASTVFSDSPTTSNQASSSTSVSEISSPSASPTAEPVYFYNVTTLAGSGLATFANGMGKAASFANPYGVAVDSTGTVYIADTSNNRIRKISFLGDATTLAGSGSLFNNPTGVAVDSNGTVFVADLFNHRIRTISSLGTVTTLAGSGIVTADPSDGPALAASFNYPIGVAVDSNGTVYVAEYGRHVIRKISSFGIVSTFAGSGVAGFADGVGLAASFNSPSGVAVDSNGTVYVADQTNNVIRKISPSGNVTTLAGSVVAGFANGVGAAALFNSPTGVAVDSNGTVYVADFSNNRIRMISPSGNVTTCAGSGTAAFADGAGLAASFNTPYGVAVDSNGTIYVADLNNNRIRKITLVLA